MLLVTSFVPTDETKSAGVNNTGGIMGKMTKDSSESKNEMKKVRPPFILNLVQNGTANVTTILDSTKSMSIRSGFVTLRRNEDVGSHNTGEHEEILIILHGKGIAEIEGFGKKKIKEGMAVYIPPNDQHDIYCTTSVPLQYVYVVAPVR